MGLVLPTCLLFVLWKAEARWTLLAVAVSLFASDLIGVFFGWSRLWGLSHLLFWTPLVVYLVRRWPRLEFQPRLAGRELGLTPLFRSWAVLTVGTMGVSLVFDLWDVLRFAVTGV